MIEINEYDKIQKEFVNQSNILENNIDTLYTLKTKNNEYSILIYDENKTIKVPNALIPFWSKNGDCLKYEDGKFNRIIK